MPVNIDDLHPHRFPRLVAEYDDRAAQIARTARELRRDSRQTIRNLASHEHILAEEYGAKSREEFTHRVTLALAVNELTRDWQSSGGGVFDVSTGAFVREASHDRPDGGINQADYGPIYLYLGHAPDMGLARNPTRWGLGRRL
jgi:hypothetical protein